MGLGCGYARGVRRHRSVWLVASVLALASARVPASGQVGSVGSVAETGGPVHKPGAATVRGGPVYESRLPAGNEPRLPLSGVSVRLEQRGVYGDGPVRAGTVGSVATAEGAPPVRWFPPASAWEEAAPVPPPEEPLLDVVRAIEPLPRASEAGTEETAEQQDEEQASGEAAVPGEPGVVSADETQVEEPQSESDSASAAADEESSRSASE